MNNRRVFGFVAAGVALLAMAAGPAASPVALAAPPKRPNVLVIVTDDLGFSDLGAFGGEIPTPNLDRLATAGVRFTGFHTAPTCSPTRAMLLTGADHHEVGLGSMAELIDEHQRGKPGYEGALNDRAVTLATRLKAAGYFTALSGKWHLGLKPEQNPAAQGFEKSFALLQGGSNHFGLDQGPPYASPAGGATYTEDGARVGLPKDFYSTDHFTDRLIGFLKDRPKDGRPFFAYLSYTAPHWPLQAPEADIARYKGRYDKGPEALRQERLERQRELGLLAPDTPVHEPAAQVAWESLTPAERANQARKMEVYAAMVDRLDQAVGRLLASLEASGELENTVIVFLSDNGAEGGEFEKNGVLGQTFSKWIAGTYDNSTANIGAGSSYVWYGPQWAQAATAPSWLFKAYTTEGGTRTPAFVSGPGVKGRRISDAFLHVSDITPTALDLAGAPTEVPAGKAPIQGRSWAGLLKGGEAPRGPNDTPVGWELFYARAVRQGDWKAVFLPGYAKTVDAALPTGRWLLFDLGRDPGETTDLSKQEPARLKSLVDGWNAYAKRTGVVVAASSQQGETMGPSGGVTGKP